MKNWVSSERVLLVECIRQEVWTMMMDLLYLMIVVGCNIIIENLIIIDEILINNNNFTNDLKSLL